MSNEQEVTAEEASTLGSEPSQTETAPESSLDSDRERSAALTGEIERLRDRTKQLLVQLVGEEHADANLGRIYDSGHDLRGVAHAIATAASTERLYKLHRTSHIQQSDAKASDPSYVGLADFDGDAPFDYNFRTHFAPRLGKRASGFEVMFAELAKQNARPFIVETGCLRVAGNWEGDGQSTFLFDTFARSHRGWFMSIDVNLESIETARRACSHATQLILNDSVAALNALSSMSAGSVSLLYLDSFDLDVDNPTPSAIHHALELAAGRSLLRPGALVVIDDFGVGNAGGKGMIVNDFFARSSAEVLYDGYQKVWRV